MNVQTPRYAGVIFDMDGVLCDSEPLLREAASLMFDQVYGLKVDHQEFKPFTGTGEDRFITGVAEARGLKLNMPQDKLTTYRIYLALIRGRLQPLPGVGPFIRDCRRRNFKLAVASSADLVKVRGNLEEIGLAFEQFDTVVTGSDVTRKKPHPEGFLLAASSLGVSARDCLVVEDAPSGIQAAKSAGAKCLALTSSFPPPVLRQAGADWVAPDLAQVPPEVLAD